MNSGAGSRRIRTVVAEDSATTLEYLVQLLRDDPAIEVVGTARNGLEAIERVERWKPDILLMDVLMPHMSGYEAARSLMERTPLPIVMMSASFDREAQKMTFQAIEAGALTVVAKPCGPGQPGNAESGRRLADTLKLMAEVRVVRRWPRSELPQPLAPAALPRTGGIRLVAIAASTGGPAAVIRILKHLPGSLGVPILVVQHIAPGFAQGFSEWISQETPFRSKLAESGEVVQPGAVYVAPEGQQMEISAAGRIRLTDEPGEDGFKPSATYLFSSIAASYGSSAAGVILTGMGRDGAAGLRRLREAGGLTLAQSEESSVVPGMPQEAVRLGAVEQVLDPDAIAAVIASAARGEL